MCGFAGFVSIGIDAPTTVLARMGKAIEHRGPDDSGLWHDPETGLGFVHRRLAILDLSSAGHQPMTSISQRYTLIFNGEIYNHLLLRQELDMPGLLNWRGHSDTETLLAGFERWGIEATLNRAVGMFAMAIWDQLQQQLILVRDRLGEKPLYYGFQGGHFLFGSELKALRAHPAFTANIDRQALIEYFRHNYIPAPLSIYQGIRKLMPGQMLTLSPGSASPHYHNYWCLSDVVEKSAVHPWQGTAEDAVHALEQVLGNAVEQQLISDVPLGAFLSGGVDSSTIVALMQKHSVRKVRTFSIGFDDKEFNEAEHALAIAQHLGTDHTELYVSSQDALNVIPKLPAIYDEPFADSSQIPTYLVSAMAKQHVTVSLSGDGGDELFCGYQRYTLAQQLQNRLGATPQLLRQCGKGIINTFSASQWNSVLSPFQPLFPSRYRTANIGDKLHKFSGLLAADDGISRYLAMISHSLRPEQYVKDGTFTPGLMLEKSLTADIDYIPHLMYLDSLSYLPDDILVKVDRAAMAVSLEGRVPFLDHRVVEFAAALPQQFKLRDGQTKWCLRQVLYRHVPRQLIERTKMGFAVPVAAWLRGPLREWAEQLLDPVLLQQQGILNVEYIRQLWLEHLSGSRNWHSQLWNVLMFQAWLAHQQESVAD
ncbi:asparagine synthase (glutamine-hydrolyzing) [Rheinheimera riviphila]|uniref:asparagine synthase (glutamine-hydrolyzing) n=1 Tax=Rheinheimera riviphila TaxID=1834037 RepID=A0A437R3C6_9GAMM|nr:asparagine synthase (glutamine-hydrolyzing) [Rheinheimera riviphila]RVU41289.1 asparagine synthase (glutamine-hydrolyzing) [Rheinheimera riviphila]